MNKICTGNLSPSCETPDHADSSRNYWNSYTKNIKGPLSIVNSVVMYKAQLTEVTLEPTAFNFTKYVWQAWIRCEICTGKSFSYAKFPIMQIPIEMTFAHKIHRAAVNVTGLKNKKYTFWTW